MAELALKSPNGEKHVLREEAVQRLREKLRGTLVSEGDPGYDEARKIYNAMIDRRPAMIVRCVDAADVIACVDFARENDVLVAVRGGGHNGAGLGTCDGGLVIDLSPQRGVLVDPEGRSARVQAGCTWGDVDHATHAFGLAAVSGIISTTGVSGLTLGGGHGYLSRKCGLTIDNLRSVNVVLADGRMVRASEQENPDLFWAIRGGGGNFGVVTAFDFQLHPVSHVVAGPMFWSLDDAGEILRAYREFMPAAPEEVYGFFAFLTVPPVPPFPTELHGRTVCGVVWCHLSSEDEAHAAMQPLRNVREPLFEHVGTVPYPALQSFHDALYPAGDQWYWKGDFIREIPDEAVQRHLEFGSNLPTPQSSMHLYPIDGAVHRVGPQDTAFAYRDVHWSQVIVGVDHDPAKAEHFTKWTRDYWNAIHPYSAGGAYVNFMMSEGDDRVRATYGQNFDRLRELKRRYDPHNLFRMNQNIAPD